MKVAGTYDRRRRISMLEDEIRKLDRRYACLMILNYAFGLITGLGLAQILMWSL